MIKNNIKALLIHIVISIFSFIFSMLFHNSSAKWVSEEAANQHHVAMLRVSVLIIIVSLFLYYHFSRKFLTNQLSIIKNILSFSIIGLIGMVLWLTAFYTDLTSGTQILLNSELWQWYSLYYGYCMSLVYEITATNPYIMLVFGSLPIIVMCLGAKKSSITETKQ
ncbi:hypothetical protein ACQPVP_01350 [Clostridium nigeriense]|uniref:hypothetical protein n=1 Tax=Clostridium nigeriense TaxID=1805470 RepID=UPI003D325EBA